ACSQSTARDIVRLLDVDPGKITVTYEAVDDEFLPVDPEAASALLAARYGIQRPFILFVGTLEPRKNLTALARAYTRLATDLPHALVLAGAPGWQWAELAAAIAQSPARDRIVLPGYVPRGDLPAFYSAADALAYPSRYEGFGLPVLEAMTCGCPVVTSNNSCLPEVAGDAALLVDAADEAGLESALRTVLEDAATRAALIERGRAQARAFSWQACAETTLGVYKGLASC
ncbi:MAG: glycosyltransferase family 4 protein, partial [Candidatus Hydrogenedentes bacterium]|nr:glycosyltransferase family 4 protein [Candidatus Hydrogenedentota bacterium]